MLQEAEAEGSDGGGGRLGSDVWADSLGWPDTGRCRVLVCDEQVWVALSSSPPSHVNGNWQWWRGEVVWGEAPHNFPATEHLTSTSLLGQHFGSVVLNGTQSPGIVWSMKLNIIMLLGQADFVPLGQEEVK
eukprot:gene26500-biopygen3732